MAAIFKSLVLASALFAAISSAAPVVWETATTVVWTTVDVTTTIYPTPQAPTPTTPVVAEPTTPPAPAPEQPKPIEPSEQPQPQVPEPQPTQPVAAAVAAPAPTEPAPQPAPPTANSGSGGYASSCSKGSSCVGQLTYYDTATSASAPSSCGMTNDGFTENVVALPIGIMTDADCGKTVTITYNSITKTGTVVDKCMGCDPTSCDVSRHFFGELADLDAGHLHGVSWYIN